MTQASTHLHPKPALERLQQYGGAALLLVILLAIPLQALLGLALGGFLFLMTALLLALLALPVVMLITVSPGVTVDDDGLHLHPRIWRARFIPWGDVLAVKDYPLLPRREQETERRLLQGKRRYQAAQGKMLIVRGLPPQYRVAGYFAGEGGQPIIALTNRSHSDYERLIKRVLRHTGNKSD